jgi:NDP-sugar pyrophosphorylase family protein
VMLTVAILAGGLATRLRPITTSIPKALVEVAGEPFIAHQLRYLKAQGITEVVLCTGYLGEMIEAVVNDGAAFGVKVTYSPDGAKLLGTGGALRQALPLLGDEFFILYGDSFLPVDFKAVEDDFHHSKQPALMTVLKNDDRWDKSNVIFKDGQIVEYNKAETKPDMKFIDYGLGVIKKSVLQAYPANEVFDLATVYHQLSITGQLAGHEVHERFYEIGSFEGLKETEEFLSSI